MMLDATGCRTEKQVGQETVSVRAHGHQIAAFLLNPPDYFRDGIAESQFSLHANSDLLKLCGNFF
jgi:hypothetical protein